MSRFLSMVVPKGFLRSLAIFARNLVGATPIEQGSPISWRMSPWILLR